MLAGLAGEYLWLGFAALVLATTVVTFRDYFDVWSNAQETRAAYFSNFKAVMDYLRHSEYSGSVTLSSAFPGLPHDPFSVDLRVRRDDLDFRWFDAREALVFPQTATSLLVLPVNARPDPIFAVHLPLNTAVRHEVRATDVDPYFDVVVWDPQRALNTWLADGTLTPADSRADFGGAVALVAYGILTPALKPGNTVTTVTFWRVLDPTALGPRNPINYAPEAQLFVHVFDSQGSFVLGGDRLYAPAWNWHAGDTFAQIHRLTLSGDIQPGVYSLQVGIYTLPDLKRLTGVNFDSYDIGTLTVVGP